MSIFLSLIGLSVLLVGSILIKKGSGILGLILLFASFVLTASGVVVAVVNVNHRAAVDAGHAEYYLDAETHAREWRWLPSCAEEKP